MKVPGSFFHRYTFYFVSGVSKEVRCVPQTPDNYPTSHICSRRCVTFKGDNHPNNLSNGGSQKFVHGGLEHRSKEGL